MRSRLGFSTNSKSELKAHVKSCGSPFFDPSTMRFFNSRLEAVIPGKNKSCFVTSERFVPSSGPPSPRKFTVKKIVGCKIDTYGEFQQYRTRSEAVEVARDCANGRRRR